MEASRGVRSVSGRLVSFRLDVSRRLMASRGVSGGQGSLVSSLRQAGGVRPASKGKSSPWSRPARLILDQSEESDFGLFF